MKNIKSVSRFVRVSPKKARLAADLIRGMKVEDALMQLKHSGLKTGVLLAKTLKSAIANAETREDAKRENLKIDEVKVDAGVIMKRAKAKSRGSQVPVLKRTSHFTIVLKSV